MKDLRMGVTEQSAGTSHSCKARHKAGVHGGGRRGLPPAH